MKILNPWVGYTQRSYQQIKASILGKLRAKTPEMTDFTESNPMIILVSIFAGLTEHLNYYIDSVAREMFIGTARQFASVLKLARYMGYNSRGAIPASVSIQLSIVDFAGDPAPLGSDYIIPSGTVITSSDSTARFVTIKDFYVYAGATSFFIEAINLSETLTISLGTAALETNLELKITDLKYAHKTGQLSVDSGPWVEVDTLAFSKSTDTHYEIYQKSDGFLYVKFGDGVNGKQPNGAVSLTYQKSEGFSMNTLLPGTLDTSSDLDSLFSPEGQTLIVNNPSSPSGGCDIENLDRVRSSAYYNLRTLDRAVTYQDYFDILQTVPGVAKGEIDFCCSSGQGAILYVVPEGGGIANNTLLEAVDDYFFKRKTIGVKTTPKPAGELKLVLTINAVVFQNANLAEAMAKIQLALKEEFTIYKQNINGDIRKSDVIALISNLPFVDYLTSVVLSCKPYARPLNTTVALLFDGNIKTTSTGKHVYLLIYQGSNNWFVFKDGASIGGYVTGATFNDENLNFVISNTSYVTGAEYQFTTYAYDQDIVITDFTIGVYNEGTTTVTTQRATSSIRNKNC